MNVALYARGRSAWTLAERAITDHDREATGMTIGASTMRWDGDRLVVAIDERTTPLGRPLRGTVVLHPEAHSGLELSIDERGDHRWWPVAPLARIEVDFTAPCVRFSGHGYHDANAGRVPLEDAFDRWSWSRARTPDAALMTYDVSCTSGAERSHAFRVTAQGVVEELEGCHRTSMSRTVWGLDRQARVDPGARARVVRSLEDGPFYARSLIETTLGGRAVLAIHETLAAQRLRKRWVRFCTAFRM